MKQFVGKLVAFLAVVLVLSFALDVVITTGLHRHTDYTTEVWNDLRDASFNHDVIVLGSCQAMHDINPYVLDSMLDCDSYVLAMSNLTFPCHDFMWRMYMHYHENMPKMILLVLDYGDMSFREIPTSQENKQFLPLIDVALAREFLTSHGGYKKMEIYTPLYRYYGYHQMIKDGIRSWILPKKGQRVHQKGFIPLDKAYSFNKADYGTSNIVPIENEIVVMLDGFIAECKDKGIKVVMVVPPLGDELADLIANSDDIYAVYKEEAEKYSCPIWIYPKGEYTADTSSFETPMHLNAQGAYSYTVELAKWIRSLNVYKQ